MRNKVFAGLALILILISSACENPFFPDAKNKNLVIDDGKIPDNEKEPDDENTTYNIVIDFHDKEEGDTVTAEPQSGVEGEEITLSYILTNKKINNLIVFSGIFTEIESVTSAGSGIRTYVIDPEDAIDGVITIIATFTHTDLTIDEIEFTEESPIIHKTYGDDPFTNAIKAGHLGTGAITYSSEDEEVATVSSNGTVTVHNAGTTVITAQKAADAVYAHASVSYTLSVAPMAITVTPDALNKIFGSHDPELTFTAEPPLLDEDSFEGALSREEGESTGHYLITQGNLNAGSNYSIIITEGVLFSILQFTGEFIEHNHVNAEYFHGITLGDLPLQDNYTWDSPETEIFAGDGQTFPATYTDPGGNYNPVGGNIEVNISKANPQVTWPSASTITYGEPLSSSTLTGGSGSGSFAWTNSGTIPIIANSGYQVTFTPADTANYNTLTHIAEITVNRKTLTITGVTAIDRDYIGGNTTVTLTGGTLQGVVQGDTMEFFLGDGTMANAYPGNAKPVTTSIYIFDGNYALTQPVVTVNITKSAILEEILEEIAANMEVIEVGHSFQMGQCASGNNVTPVHTVTLTQSFSMSKYQVTQEQYMAVMGNNPSRFSSNPAVEEIQGKRPVETVSWYNAIVFCNSLSMLEGLTPAYNISGSTDPYAWGAVPTSSNAAWDAVVVVADSTGYRLPTEAQWEYTAKGGHLSQGYIYAGSNDADEVAWNASYDIPTHQVGLKAPNELGLYDMSGNVYEWCWDWYEEYTSDAKTDPMGASSGSDRVIRGGEFSHSVNRGFYFPFLGKYLNGFRLLRP